MSDAAIGSLQLWHCTLNHGQWRVALGANLGWPVDRFTKRARLVTVGIAPHRAVDAAIPRRPVRGVREMAAQWPG
jgi:hypothetical protein